jgi:serine/threonine-protein kinase mTOR
MLINAMEVSGIEGNFRITCEAVMGVLRDNHDSLMAVLEAFVYDPLLNWRLFTPETPGTHHTQNTQNTQNTQTMQNTHKHIIQNTC